MLSRQNKFTSPFGARGGKSAIGLILRIVNFEVRVMKLSMIVLGLNMRLFGQIGKINLTPSLVLGGLKVQKGKFSKWSILKLEL